MKVTKTIPFGSLLTQEQKELLEARNDRPVPPVLWQKMQYRPNDWAYTMVHTSGARFSTYVTARQVGKTVSLAAEIAEAMTAPIRYGDKTAIYDDEGKIISSDPNAVGVVSYDYEHALKPVYRYIQLLTKLYGDDRRRWTMNKNEHNLTLFKPNGQVQGILQWFTAEQPRSTEGNTFTSLFFDEAQGIPDEVWNSARPALDARNARVMVFGTPDPVPLCSWFKGLFLKGLDIDSPDYFSFTLPCWQNDWTTTETIIDAYSTMASDEFKKKYLGEWVDDEGSVFKHVDDNIRGSFSEPVKGTAYIGGLDLGKKNDFTVLYVVDQQTQQIVSRYRVSGLDYTKVADRISDIYARYHLNGIHMDATGLGEPVADELKKRNLNIWSFIFSNKSKEQLVSNLARELDHKRVGIPKSDKELVRELKAFTKEVTPSGNIRYSAPINFHDDCVAALGLALLKTRHNGGVTVSSYINQPVPAGIWG